MSANKLTKQIFGEFSLRKIENEGTLTTVKQSPCWETGFDRVSFLGVISLWEDRVVFQDWAPGTLIGSA